MMVGGRWPGGGGVAARGRGVTGGTGGREPGPRARAEGSGTKGHVYVCFSTTYPGPGRPLAGGCPADAGGQVAYTARTGRGTHRGGEAAAGRGAMGRDRARWGSLVLLGGLGSPGARLGGCAGSGGEAWYPRVDF
jgi:hypothetical protein